jgi:outer membrane lipopolysaccharide assembly protein LptE/RlpB
MNMAEIAGTRTLKIALLTLCVALWGCGYQLGGGGNLLPQDAQTVFVEPFINRTREVGIGPELTTAVRGELYRRGRLRLVDQAEQADVILSGVVRSLDTQTSSVNRFNEALQYEAHLILDVNLRRREPNEILWRGPGIKLSQTYAGSRAAVVTTSSEFRAGTLNDSDVRGLTDVQLTESQRTQAREQLMARFAQDLHQRLMEMF